MEVNKIIQGDCLNILKEMPDNFVDLVITSPPYNCGIAYDVCKDNLKWEDYYNWCEKWLRELLRILKSDGRFCLNHYLSFGQSNNRHTPLMKLNEIAIEIGFKHHGIAIWTDITLIKRTAWGSWKSASAPYVNSPYEGILILYKDKWKKEKQGISTITDKDFMMACSGVWNIGTDKERLTPATFPKRLPELCINLLSYENDLILDPFAGSFTTCVVAKMLNRNYIGIEISPDYCRRGTIRLAEETNLFKGGE
ncbi:MAG: site-specific DNA-methyltransferase [Ignavibacteria bacterium]|nr:site-specific DNA-methyltransferase [Ignavibacteria bacterium]